MAGIYIHVPFCKQACYYCDFHFSTNQEKRVSLVRAIAMELALQKNYLGSDEKIKTIYFGGGTPSLLTIEELNLLYNAVIQHFKLDAEVEITLEANPDDLTLQKLKLLKEAGINRLSIGVQSFDDHTLSFLNRAHLAKNAITAVEDARQAGFTNISIDLIFSIPGRGRELLLRDIDTALRLNPEHISVYSLTIEEKTVFGRWAARGKFLPVDDDLAAIEMELLMDKLEQAGYDHYEISNFAKPGFLSMHNSGYWKQEKYLGAGPSAHSFNGATRQSNISNNHLYLKSLTAGKIPSDVEHLSTADTVNDYILTGLRTKWGCDLRKLSDEFNVDLLESRLHYIEQLVRNELIILDDRTLKLTRKGKLLADKISVDLFI